MKLTIISTAIATSMLLFSCSSSSNENATNQTETVSQEEHHHDENKPIELNNGEKWDVDTNMMTLIRNMETDVVTFKGSALLDYNSLAKKLQVNIDLLTSNCTMKGQAHDELHKWLLPYIDMVEDFEESKDETEAAKQFEDIKASFTTFNQYFK